MDSSHQQARGDWPQGRPGSLPTGGPQSLEAEGKAIPCVGGMGKTEGGPDPPVSATTRVLGAKKPRGCPPGEGLRGPLRDRATFNCVVPCSWGPHGGDPCTDSKREGAVPPSVPQPRSEGFRGGGGEALAASRLDS